MDQYKPVHQLCVSEIRKTIKDRVILDDVSFSVERGEMLAILGPTGSGKSTLLNIINGRLKRDSGSITVDGRPVDKRIRRRFGYVLQNDVFISNLTLWQTLYFTAQIQMSESMCKADKLSKLEAVVEAMDLSQCLHTVIGDTFVRGLSGGEKKRASIACELLTDPLILFLDEPTSGLDSSTAHSIIQHLKSEAVTKKRIVVITIHQPSSQIFYNFEKLLLITDGKTLYRGSPEDVQEHFSNLGLHCRVNYNPADFLLELAKSDQPTLDRITRAVAGMKSLQNGHQNNMKSAEINVTTDVYRKLPDSADCHINKAFDTRENGTHIALEMKVVDPKSHSYKNSPDDRWPTSFWHQLKMLTWRGFIQTKGKFINRYLLAEVFIVATSIAVGFFRIGVGFQQRRDVMGLLFVTYAYWSFQVTIAVILSLQEQRPVIAKERASGMYRVSALYISKTITDIPIWICWSSAIFTINFWAGQLGDGIVFMKTLGLFILWVLLSQVIGYTIGTGVKNARLAFTVFQSYSISSFVYGGFFIQNLPSWLNWAKYLSIYTYIYSSSVTIVFSPLDTLSCNSITRSNFTTQQPCLNNTMTMSDVILEEAGIDLPVLYYVLPIIGIDLCLRIIAYFCLRFRRDSIA